jgi:hypothetical protein
MATSALATLREYQRQKATGDNKYYRHMLMFFELKIPGKLLSGSANSTYLFPLKVSPDSYTLAEPFTLEKTPTQGGGLYVEENGIVGRTIRISGVTGFAPRPLNANGPASLFATSPEKRSHSRTLPPIVGDAISGQRHFQYLQDAVFRTYADLKRDPATAEDTKLMFHVPKDDEHWLVVPVDFQLSRDAGQRTLYRYNIELLVVDRATAVDETVSEDSGFLAKMTNAIETAQAAISLAQGAINDLTAVMAEVSSVVNNVVQIIDGVSGVLASAEAFVTGVADFIETPLAVLESLGRAIDEAESLYETWEEAGERIQTLPSKLKDKWAQLGQALDLLRTHPETFEPTNNAQLATARALVSPLLSQSPETLAAAKGLAVPTTVAGYNELGTQMTPGDLQEADAYRRFAPESLIGKYKSATQVSVVQGDTLASLAARHLKDARLWQDIAIVNGLKPPFTNKQASLDLRKADEAALPGVRGIGDKILIPSLSKGQKDLPNPATLGAKSNESAEVQFLGRDIKLELVGSVSSPGTPLYDIPIDVARGGLDVGVVEGLANLSQGITLRLITERGTDVLYKSLGMQRVIGTNQVATDLDLARFRAAQALQQDSRIASVRRVTFEGLDGGTTPDPVAPLDALVIDAEVEVRGFTESANVRIAV